MAGLAQYSKYFENPLFTATMKEVAVKADYIGNRFLPTENTYDLDFHETVVKRQQDMANLVDSGAEIPLTDRDPVQTISGEIVDIAQSYIVSKKELAALAEKGNDGKRKIAEVQLLKKSALLKQNIDARIEWLRWQALGKGQLTYSKDGIILGVDFGVPTENKVSAATKWDQAGATILTNYEKWVQDYVDLNGETPDTAVAGINVIRVMLNNTDLRKAVTGYSDKVLTINELNTFLTARQMPKLEAFDAKVAYRDVTTGGTRVSERLLSDKVISFLKEGGAIGAQLMGPTVENDMNPGIFARTFTMERPLREVIEVVAASFPKIADPNLIKIATVLA